MICFVVFDFSNLTFDKLRPSRNVLRSKNLANPRTSTILNELNSLTDFSAGDVLENIFLFRAFLIEILIATIASKGSGAASISIELLLNSFNGSQASDADLNQQSDKKTTLQLQRDADFLPVLLPQGFQFS